MDFFWEGSRSKKPYIFPYKMIAAGDKRYLVCAAVAAAVVSVANGFLSLYSVTSGYSCVRSSICFLNLRLQIAMKWL